MNIVPEDRAHGTKRTRRHFDGAIRVLQPLLKEQAHLYLLVVDELEQGLAKFDPLGGVERAVHIPRALLVVVHHFDDRPVRQVRFDRGEVR